MGWIDLLLGRDLRALGVPIGVSGGAPRPRIGADPDPYDLVYIGDRTALAVPAIFGSIDLIAGTVAATPFAVRDAGNVLAEPQPLVVERPDPDKTRQEAVYTWVEAYLLRGEFYLRKYAKGEDGRPRALALIPNDEIEPYRTRAGVKRFLHNGQDLSEVEVRHVKWMSLPNSEHGYGPIQLARSTIAAYLASAEFTRRLYVDGGIVTSVLKHPLEISPGDAANLKQQWVTALSGTREPAVLSGGLDYSIESPNLVDMQLLDLRREGVLDCCRLFKIPPTLLAAEIGGSSLTYQNVTQLWLEFIRLQSPLFTTLEAVWSEVLPPGQYVYADLDAWLRPDPRGQLDAVIAGVQAGIFTNAEGRNRLGLAPMAGATPSVRTVGGGADAP